MTDIVNLKGHFKIQSIDVNNNVIDEWEEDNMIMENARYTMSELFSNLSSSTFINKFKLGTSGHDGNSIITPKTKDQGFVKERNRMFSEFESYATNSIITIIRKNDIIFNSSNSKFYQYLINDSLNYNFTDANFTSPTIFRDLGTVQPYIFNVNFELPGSSDINGVSALNISDDDHGGCSVNVLQSGTSVTFRFDVSTAAANKQYDTYSVFTEASLWANDRIFAMKTFKAKTKDSTVLLRIIWTITF
jgi:hypothetical protein